MRRVRALLGEPTFWVRLHGVLAALWFLLIVPSVLWWRESIWWIVLMSCYANFAGSVASWTAARADQNSPTREDVARLEAKLDVLAGRLSLLTRGR